MTPDKKSSGAMGNDSSTTKSIGATLKGIFWPIEKSEVKLFIPMALMMLCVLFNFGALRSVKDSLVVPNIGAESISFLKLWLVLPSTVIFTVIYLKLSNIFSYERVFYKVVSAFLIFFFLFTYVLYPQQEFFHPSPETINALVISFPNLKWFILIAGKWSYAIMYIFCELWSVVVINLMFWQYANHIFDSTSAKRFYPILGMIGNIGLIIAGNVLVSISSLSGVADEVLLNYKTDTNLQCEHVLKPMIHSILFAGIAAMALYRYIEAHVLKTIRKSSESDSHLNSIVKDHSDAIVTRSLEQTKTKLTLSESIKLIIQSKYIAHIGLLVLCYGLVINVLEGPWKSKVKELYPNTVDYMQFMGKFNIWMGVSCVIFTIIGSNILRRTSWLIAAMTTPIMIAVTGTIFFSFMIIRNKFDVFSTGGDVGGYGLFVWVDPLYAAVLVGAAQNILSKSSKYSLFDATKEMSYIPLSLELRTKGKAAVEVIGLKLGKSLGAFIQSSMFILMPLASFDSVAQYLMVFFTVVVVAWIWNVRALNKEYLKLA